MAGRAVKTQRWNAIVRAIKATHRDMMERGAVTIPTLLPFVGGELVGSVALRQVYRGWDAAKAVAEMAQLAAAAAADEIVVSWDSLDLAVACDEPPRGPSPELDVVRATPTQATLHRFPYTGTILAGRTTEGLWRAEPRWMPQPRPDPDPELPPAIATLVHFSWKPFDAEHPQLLEYAAAYLDSQGYYVELTEPLAPAD